ncbi:HU family DNA-binding protein [Actinoalloteichus hoggarensis]|uniref:HU family DNA-binding protein n=1 Tax=Actinoalloteichus hoggarensis TaxID=1470176 RepID=UPI0031842DE7
MGKGDPAFTIGLVAALKRHRGHPVRRILKPWTWKPLVGHVAKVGNRAYGDARAGRNEQAPLALPGLRAHCSSREGPKVNKAELVDALSQRLGDKKTAGAAVDELLDVIVRSVNKGDKVNISGFGVFEKRARAARTARNPRTGEAVKVKKTTVPAFRPGTNFKEVIDGSRKLPRLPTQRSTSTSARSTTQESKPSSRSGSTSKSSTSRASSSGSRSTGTRSTTGRSTSGTSRSRPSTTGSRSSSASSSSRSTSARSTGRSTTKSGTSRSTTAKSAPAGSSSSSRTTTAARPSSRSTTRKSTAKPSSSSSTGTRSTSSTRSGSTTKAATSRSTTRSGTSRSAAKPTSRSSSTRKK